MGSMALSNHYRSEDLLDIETAAGGFQQRKGMRQSLPLTFCFHTGLSQYMALESTEGRTRSEIFYQCPVRSPPSYHSNLSCINMHLCRAGEQLWKVKLWYKPFSSWRLNGNCYRNGLWCRGVCFLNKTDFNILSRAKHNLTLHHVLISKCSAVNGCCQNK